LNPAQSKVLIIGGTIELADYGLVSYAGGIIRVSQTSLFKNCNTGIQIASYTSATNPKYNASYIMDTEFKWLITPDRAPIGIELDNVAGINIGGCKFWNNDPNLYDFVERGIGIKATNADMNVSSGGNTWCINPETCLDNCDGSNPGAGNEFKHLSWGIKFVGGSTNNHLAVRASIFDNCLYGIDVTSGISASIAKNTFTGSVSV